MNYPELEKRVEVFVRSTFYSFSDTEFPYHNLDHTVRVVVHARRIAHHYFLEPKELCILTVAAWFHDIGHLFGSEEEHEETGVVILQNYVEPLSLPDEIVAAIAGCILATRLPSHPRTLPEEILCDADTYHFGTEYFKQSDDIIRREIAIRTGREFTNAQWHEGSLQLLRQHRYFTGYCQQHLDEGKRRNIAWLLSLKETDQHKN